MRFKPQPLHIATVVHQPKTMKETALYLKSQYQLVQQSRKTLFDYCRTISPKDFVNQNNSFGRGGSIRNLLVHIANTYEFWIIKHALQNKITFTEYSTKNSIEEVENLFRSIDNGVFKFLDKYETKIFEKSNFKINGVTRSISAFELFTHMITHEFHHKGQILSLSRHLGYIPVDTDIIR